MCHSVVEKQTLRRLVVSSIVGAMDARLLQAHHELHQSILLKRNKVSFFKITSCGKNSLFYDIGKFIADESQFLL